MRMKGGQTERRKGECYSAKSLFSNLPLDDSCFRNYILEIDFEIPCIQVSHMDTARRKLGQLSLS